MIPNGSKGGTTQERAKGLDPTIPKFCWTLDKRSHMGHCIAGMTLSVLQSLALLQSMGEGGDHVGVVLPFGP